jgi:hypothetical protein
MLYLFHETQDGTPIGVWTEGGRSFYADGHEALQQRGELAMKNRGENQDWTDWVDSLEGTLSPLSRWSSMELTVAPLEEVLSVARDASQYPDDGTDREPSSETADGK